MSDRGRLFTVAVTLAAVSLVCGAAVAGALTAADTGAQDRAAPETGQQVATVIAVTDEEVRREVGASAIEAAAERGDGDALAERAATLAERGDRIASEFETATAAYENGTLTADEYAWRLALLHARAGAVSDGIDHVERRATDVPPTALDDAGYDAGALAGAREAIDPLTGRGLAALLAQYTGEAGGSFTVETDGGLSVEVETDEGEYSREFERERAGDGGAVEIDGLTALSAARDALSGADGAWYPTELELDRDDGVYELAFVYWSGTHVGEAEVAVDAATGDVFSLEADREPHDGSASRLGVDVRDGSLEPGGTVTLAVERDGEPAAGATVFLDGEELGDTDDAGTVTVSLPRGDDIDITVEHRDAEAELELGFDPPEDEFDDPPDDSGDDEDESGDDDDVGDDNGEDTPEDEDEGEVENDDEQNEDEQDDDGQDDELPEEHEDEEETEQEDEEETEHEDEEREDESGDS